MVPEGLVRLSPLSFLAALISRVSGVTILRWATSRCPASRPWDTLRAITARPVSRISLLNDAHRWPGVDLTASTERSLVREILPTQGMPWSPTFLMYSFRTERRENHRVEWLGYS